jgi:hypothetical protein
VGRADGVRHTAPSAKNKSTGKAKASSNVMRLDPTTSRPKGKTSKSAEEAIPFGDNSGTFGSF